MSGLWSAGVAAAIVDIRNRAAAVENRSPRRHARTYDVPIARIVAMNTLSHSPPPHAASHQAGPGWYWMVPRVAIALFLLAIGTLVWWLHRNDLDEQRATMINDVLWMEQDLRFHLDRNAEQMAQIGREAADGRLDARVIEARQRNMIANGHGLLRVDTIAHIDAGDPDLSGPARLAEQLRVEHGVAGQAHGIGDEQRHGHDHEDRLQHAFNQKSGHEAPPGLSPRRISRVNASNASQTSRRPIRHRPPLAGCRGAGFAGPLACPLEGEARSASGVGSTVYSTAVSRNRKRMSPGTSRPFTRLFTPTMVFRLYSGSSSAWSAT